MSVLRHFERWIKLVIEEKIDWHCRRIVVEICYSVIFFFAQEAGSLTPHRTVLHWHCLVEHPVIISIIYDRSGVYLDLGTICVILPTNIKTYYLFIKRKEFEPSREFPPYRFSNLPPGFDELLCKSSKPDIYKAFHHLYIIYIRCFSMVFYDK